MKKTFLASVSCLAGFGAIALAAPAESDNTAKQFQSYPKNVARQHVGSNLFSFNPANQTFVPTEAAAAWLDDDVTTGWPPLAGHHYYMLALAEPELLANFCVSARSSNGRISLYAGDEPAPPSAKTWTAVAKDLDFDTVNNKKLTKPFSRFAKYLLIETNIADPGPWYGLHVYGERPAVSYHLQNRTQGINTKAIFGYVNEQTTFSMSALYARARVTHANSGEGLVSWQKAIDDNPESGVALAPSAEAGLVIRYSEPRAIQRIAVLTGRPAKGRLEFFLVNEANGAARASTASTGSEEAQYIRARNDAGQLAAAGQGSAPAVSVANAAPTAIIEFDGATARKSVDFRSTTASACIVRWVPERGAQDSISVHEINSFNEVSLAHYELALNPEAVGELGVSDGKDYKGFKEAIGEGPLEPIASFTKSPFLPGSLGFPPILDNISNPPPSPPEPPQPPQPPTPLSPAP